MSDYHIALQCIMSRYIIFIFRTKLCNLALASVFIFSGAIQTGMVTTVQNLFVIVLKNILVEIMGHVTHEITTLLMAVPVMSNTVVTIVKSAISIVPMLHVMDMVTVQIMPSYHLVTSVNVRQDLLVIIVK